MIPPYEFFRSVELVWGIWLVGCLILTLVLRRTLAQWSTIEFRELLQSEDGSTYTISYVLAFPLFMLLVCAVVQSSIILVVKMGTVYASFAAARSAVVWLEADPPFGPDQLIRRQRIRQAAYNAMAPFGSSSRIHMQRLGMTASSRASAQFDEAYRRYSQGQAPSAYIQRKYQCAERGTSIDWSPQSPTENETISLTLDYRMPLHIPWYGKLLGYPNGILPISTQVKMPFEGAVRRTNGSQRRGNTGHALGIPYYSS